jgi:cytoskeletal protein CcmA (bactofilin family)
MTPDIENRGLNPDSSTYSETSDEMPFSYDAMLSAGRRARLAVGPDVTVSGRLAFSEPVRIEGRFRGEVSSAYLVVVDSKASVEGLVRAPKLIVLGKLNGDVSGARQVMLGPLARVNGRITAASLRVCEGALVNGDLEIVPETSQSFKQTE